MSQTETLLLVVLGFAVASLLALLIGRFAWNVALRLGARRMQKQVPSTVAELQAERDRLRAEYAMLSQKLGGRLENIKMQMAGQMAEVNRHRNRLEIMMEELAGRDQVIAALRGHVESLEQDVALRKASEASLQTELAERDQKISALDSRLETAALEGNEAQVRLKQRIGELMSLSRQIAASRDGLVAAAVAEPVSAEASIDAKLEAAERDTLELQKELALLDQTWNEKLSELDKLRETGEGDGDNVISLGSRIRQQ